MAPSMPPFFKRSKHGENRIENAGRWPIRLTHFHLTDDYHFPATNYPEFFYIQRGGFLHETNSGKQAIREGFAMVIHPGHQHSISNPEDVVLSRIRFLPEWFTKEYFAIVGMPDVLTLFFDQSWLQFPREDSLHVFNTQPETREIIMSEFSFLRNILKSGQNLDPVTRLSMLKMMSSVARDFQRYWRGTGGPKLTPLVRTILDMIERTVLAGERFRESNLRNEEFDKAEAESEFREFTGISPYQYSDRRRAFHAAYALISTGLSPATIGRDGGFSDTAKFNELFEDMFEISPQVYREKFSSMVGPDETDV